MSYLDEARIEDEEVGWVACDLLRNNVNTQFNRALCGIEFAILVDIQPEICVKVMVSVRIEGVSGPVLTVITKEEFVVTGAEYAHWAR